MYTLWLFVTKGGSRGKRFGGPNSSMLLTMLEGIEIAYRTRAVLGFERAEQGGAARPASHRPATLTPWLKRYG